MDSICIVRTIKEASETFLPNGTVSFKESSKSTIGILGSGDFAKSLAIRFMRSGYSVVIGSRNPKRAVGYFPPLAEIMHHEDAVVKTDLIFVAVHREHYASLWDLKPLLVGKILVDVSNNMRINQYPEANAEYLASLFPDSTVVKGFNVISAWALQFGPRNANRQVHVNIENSWNEEEVWRMEMYISFGIMSLGLLSLLAVTSIPSVSNSVNWREFSFIHSTLGFVALLISIFHVLIYGWKRAFEEQYYRFYTPPNFVLALILPFIVIIGKVILLLPCIKKRLRKIRKGWEKSQFRDDSSTTVLQASPESVTVM